MSDTRKKTMRGNQNASRGGISGQGRIVIDLGPLKNRVVAEANRRGPGHTLKSVIVDAIEQTLPPSKP